MSQYAIEFINSTAPTVSYTDWESDNDLTLRFETEYADNLRGCDSEDIGGLIVYVRADTVCAVYDYENFCGWVV